MKKTLTASQKKATTMIGGCAIAIAKALEHKGVNSDDVLRHAGIERVPSNDPMDRLPYTTVTKLYELSVAATDPYFGLTVARFMQASNVHALGYSLLSSDTLLDFCNRLSRYIGFVSQVVEYSVEESAEEICLVGHHDDIICNETQDAFIGFVMHFMRQLYKPEFAPLRVEIPRPEPLPGPDPFIEFFNAPVRFGCEKAAIYFNKEDMLVPLNGASPELAQYNDSIIVDYLAQLEKNNIIYQVESVLSKSMSSGLVSREYVAKQLLMSPGTLKLKLNQQGVSFQKLLDQVRQNLARQYINRSATSISEIAYLLGFKDMSSFSRSFKRWTGQSPRQCRRSSTSQSC